MADKYKKERDEMNRRVYRSKNLRELKKIGKKQGLLNVDQYKSSQRNVLIERLIKGKQLSDRSRDQLIEDLQNLRIKANALMSKNTVLDKLKKHKLGKLKLKDYKNEYLEEIAKKGGIELKTQITGKEIITRIKNPDKHRSIKLLTNIAKNNDIPIPKKPKKPTKNELITILKERNLISSGPITVVEEEKTNLGVMRSNVPKKVLKAIRKPRSAREALINYKEYIKHLVNDGITSKRLQHLTKLLKKREKAYKEELNKIFIVKQTNSALKEFAKVFIIDGMKYYGGVDDFLKECEAPMTEVLRRNRETKVRLILELIMTKNVLGISEVEKGFRFYSAVEVNLQSTDEYELYDNMVYKILEDIRKIEEKGEGYDWVFLQVKQLELHTVKYEPLRGGSYIDLPIFLKNKQAMINIKNNDNKCFLWSVLRGLNPVKAHPERYTDLKEKENTLNMDGIKYPVSLRGIDRFEKQNPTIAVSVFSYNEKDKVYPLRISKYVYKREVDIYLMLLEKDEITHYCLIKSISRLLSSQVSKHNGEHHFCLRCMNPFCSQKSLEEHLEYCNAKECIKINMPEKGTVLKFKNHHHAEKVPFIIYADTEALIKSIDTCEPNLQSSYTKKYQKHEAISFSYYIKCFDDSVYEPRIGGYTGEDAMKVFVEMIEEEVKAIANIPQVNMVFGPNDLNQFERAAKCWICKEDLNGDKVRDHCHYTGRYRGAAHNSCNLKYRKPQFIPVVFHNLSGYDSHLFIKNLGFTAGNIDCIPVNMEKYISFTKNIKVGEYKIERLIKLKIKALKLDL